MSTQHTPGPWQFIPEDETAASLVESDGTSIMVMYALENSTGASHFAANTQLICAAPDLLEALRDCVKWYGNRVNDDFRNDDSLRPIDQQPPEIQRAMRAIAKATGQ